MLLGSQIIYEPSLPNLRVVTPWIYAGGEPKSVVVLKQLVTGVIDLEGRHADTEKALLEPDREFLAFPFPDLEIFDTPSLERIDEVMKAIRQRTATGSLLYIHCLHGSDRTGMVVGCLRVDQGWDWPTIHDELMKFGHSPVELGYTRAIQNYLKRYQERIGK